MERRYFSLAAFFVAWLVVLIVPETRHVFQQQIASSESSPAYPVPLSGAIYAISPKPPTFTQLAARYPDNVGVQLLAAGENQPASKQSASMPEYLAPKPEAVVKAYDETLKKFPDVAWLLASRLRLTLGYLTLGNRTAGELDAERQTLPNGQTRFKFRKPSPRTWTQSEMNAAIDVAHRGQKLEPDNGYFDAMLAYLLLAEERDNEALRVLATLKNKPRFDEHISEDTAARMAVSKRRYPNLFEGNFEGNLAQIEQAAGVLFPHYEAFRQMARVLTWKAIQRERAGDYAGALQLYDDIATFGARLREGSTLFIGFFAGQAIQHIAWNRGHIRTKEEKRRARAARSSSTTSAATQSLPTTTASRFAAYARAHGRPDLAQQTLNDNRSSEAMRSRVNEMLSNGDILGVSKDILTKTGLLFWLTMMLLAQMQWMLLAWAAATLLLLATRLVRRNRSAASSTIRALDVGGAMAWTTCVVAIALIAAALTYISPDTYESGGRAAPFFNQVIAVAPLFLGAIYCLLATAWRNFKVSRTRRASTRAGEIPKTDAAAATSSDKTLFWQSGTGKVAAFALNVTTPIMLVLAWSLSAIVGGEAAAMTDDAGNTSQLPFLSGNYGVAVIVTLLVVFWWMVRPDRRASQNSSRDSMNAVRWYRQTMFAMIVLASIAYAALGLYSLPVRAEAARGTNNYIRNSEMATLRPTTTPASTRER